MLGPENAGLDLLQTASLIKRLTPAKVWKESFSLFGFLVANVSHRLWLTREPWAVAKVPELGMVLVLAHEADSESRRRGLRWFPRTLGPARPPRLSHRHLNQGCRRPHSHVVPTEFGLTSLPLPPTLWPAF